MLLVVTIIGILAALVIPNRRHQRTRPQTAAYADINGGIKSALGAYEVDKGYYPKSLQELLSRPATPETGTGRIWNGCRWIPGAILTSIIIPANTTPPATICCRSARTARKAPRMIWGIGCSDG